MLPVLPKAPFPSSQWFLQNGGNLSRARCGCAACAPLTDSLRSESWTPRERGPGSQGACPLAEYEAAPHARLQRAPPRPCSLPLPTLLGLHSARLTPAPLSPCFHPHSDCSPRRRCPLVFLIQGVLLSLCRSEGTQSPGSLRSATTSQSPQLGAFAYFAQIQSFSNPYAAASPLPLAAAAALRLYCGS